MLDFVICASSNLFRIYLIDKFLKDFFGENRKKKKERVVIIILFWIINTALFWRFSTVWINVVSNLVGISILACLYTKDFRANIFATCFIYFINGACDIAGTALFVKYEDGVIHSQIYAAIAVFFIFVCELLCEKIIVAKSDIGESQKFPLIYIPLSGVATIVVLIYTNSCSEIGIGIVSLSLLVINFLMLYLYNLLLESISHKYEARMLAEKVKIYSNQMDVITQSEERIKGLRHDMKHHMNEIKLLANRYEIGELQNYIEQMEEYITNPNEIVTSGNVEIDSVLNYLLKTAKEELQTVNVKVILPENMVHSFHINVLLGNLLENAIEAARKTEEKFVDVSIQYKQGVLKIRVENSFSVIKRGDGNTGQGKMLLTTKKDKEKHGIGLKSVKSIIESHSGTMNISTTNNHFIVNAMLYIH